MILKDITFKRYKEKKVDKKSVIRRGNSPNRLLLKNIILIKNSN